MRVAVHRKAAFPAEQLVNGHSGPFAFDIPKRLIQSAQRVIQDRPVSPVRTGVRRLPKVVDVVRVAAAAEGIQILVNGGFYRQRALVEGCAAQPIQAGLARLDLDHDEPHFRLRSG
jgi:hypothetical protein